MTPLPCFEITSEEKRRAMERILVSQSFSRSDQLKRFLQYICEKDIAGKTEEINEYAIAVEALRRPPGYSPSDDSSVRTRAHALRQKLQEYYELEEPGAEIRIDVPKGAYSPHFSIYSPALLPKMEAALPVAVSQLPPIRSPGWRPSLLGAAAGALCMALLFSSVLWQGTVSKTRKIDSILREAWGEMLNADMPVEVCIATPPALLLHSYREGQAPFNGPNLLPAPGEVSSWYNGLQMLDGGGKLYMHTTQDVFLFGDSLAAASAVQLLSRSRALLQMVPESNLRAFALRGRNVILIGSPNYSPLAARFLMNTPFSVHYDPIKKEEVVSDGQPDHGAKHIFRPTRDELGMLTKAYGLITVLPSQAPGEGHARTVIFSGITSAGPQAALEFFRSPDALRVLKSKLREQGYASFPPAYQVVVRCGLDHNLALNWEYETHRVMNGSTADQLGLANRRFVTVTARSDASLLGRLEFRLLLSVFTRSRRHAATQPSGYPCPLADGTHRRP